MPFGGLPPAGPSSARKRFSSSKCKEGGLLRRRENKGINSATDTSSSCAGRPACIVPASTVSDEPTVPCTYIMSWPHSMRREHVALFCSSACRVSKHAGSPRVSACRYRRRQRSSERRCARKGNLARHYLKSRWAIIAGATACIGVEAARLKRRSVCGGNGCRPGRRPASTRKVKRVVMLAVNISATSRAPCRHHPPAYEPKLRAAGGGGEM